MPTHVTYIIWQLDLREQLACFELSALGDRPRTTQPPHWIMRNIRLKLIISISTWRTVCGVVWCSGYHVCFTRRRSRVRSPPWPLLFRVFILHKPSSTCSCWTTLSLPCVWNERSILLCNSIKNYSSQRLWIWRRVVQFNSFSSAVNQQYLCSGQLDFAITANLSISVIITVVGCYIYSVAVLNRLNCR